MRIWQQMVRLRKNNQHENPCNQAIFVYTSLFKLHTYNNNIIRNKPFLTQKAFVKPDVFSFTKGENQLAVFRIEKSKGYTVMSNHHLRNQMLSLKAKGLLSQMLSLPDDWDYTLKGLSRINRESVDAIRTAIWELEQAGYIVRKQSRDKKGKLSSIEYLIYEQPITEEPILENPTTENLTQEIPMSDIPTQLNKDILNTDSKNKDLPITEIYPIHSYPLEKNTEKRKGKDEIDYSAYETLIKKNIEYDILSVDNSISKDKLDEVVDIMLETVCSLNDTISIAGNQYPKEVVKSRFLKINSSHIQYVFECLNENTTKIRNIKKYLMAVLYNAPVTMENYYTALVNHDLSLV